MSGTAPGGASRGQPLPPRRRPSALAWLALAAGASWIAAPLLGLSWPWWSGWVVAMVLGHRAKTRIDRSGGRLRGRRLAIAAIALGWVGFVGFAAVLIWALATVAFGAEAAVGPPSSYTASPSPDIARRM